MLSWYVYPCRSRGWGQGRWGAQPPCSSGARGSPRPTTPPSTSPTCPGARELSLCPLWYKSFVQLLEKWPRILRTYPSLQTKPSGFQFLEVKIWCIAQIFVSHSWTPDQRMSLRTTGLLTSWLKRSLASQVSWTLKTWRIVRLEDIDILSMWLNRCQLQILHNISDHSAKA